MNKVKITNYQAKEIKKYKELVGGVYDFIHDLCDGHLTTFNDAEKEQEEMKKIMYAFVTGDFEVEQEFRVGDWIKSKLGKGVGIIIDVDDSEYYTDFGMIVPKNDDLIRYATDEEIAKEKQRRLDEKLDKILLELTDYERERLTVKLAGGNE